MSYSRRDFLRFLGRSGLFAFAGTYLQSCSRLDPRYRSYSKIKGISPTTKDDLILADGFKYKRIVSWGDSINRKEHFGFNNDYINYIPLKNNEILMWVNHEYVNPLFVSSLTRTRDNVVKEMKEVGGSIIHLKRNKGYWSLVEDSRYNRRIDALTSIPFSGKTRIQGELMGMGTHSNCAGGKTPWGTILTCEENYDQFYGDREHKEKKVSSSEYGWEKFFPNPPEHYGWVVEVDLYTGKSVKQIGLGRFAHESATVSGHTDGTVVYMGDDKADEHLYKFISESTTSLEKGTLYVANLGEGRWVPLDIEKSQTLEKHFKDQVEVLTYARKAAKLLGATPLARPEDIEIHPHTGEIFIALSNNKKRGDYHGQLLKIRERGQDHHSLSFSSSTFLMGGKENGFSCPDNLVFDSLGNLWFCSDISGNSISKGPYKNFGNNGLYLVPAGGKRMGEVIQVASAPNDAELTGLCFSPDEKSLFLSVQHPGEMTKDIRSPTSKWPFDSQFPRPSVVEISSPVFEPMFASLLSR